MNYVKKTLAIGLLFTVSVISGLQAKEKTPVDHVNPYMGNVSHLLEPTYPTVHLPNSMLRVYPLREDFTGNTLKGLPVCFTGHRGRNSFRIDLIAGDNANPRYDIDYTYDNEQIRPYLYSVYLNDIETEVRFAPSHQSAMYELDFLGNDRPSLMLSAENGELTVKNNTVYGYKQLNKEVQTKIYLYLETETIPVNTSAFIDRNQHNSRTVKGDNVSVALKYKNSDKKIRIRYGISFISEEQAKKNLYRELKDSYNLDELARKGKEIWNTALGKINVEGGSKNDKAVFYTSLYRVYERMICISEDGKYYSPFDSKVHEDNGIPFYNDDWVWDTYRAAHPLRSIIDTKTQVYMLNSFIRMAEQMENYWMPTFPGMLGDTRSMNSNHGVAVFLDCYEKGLRGFDLDKAYSAGKKAITEKTLAPWSAKKAGRLDEFYKKEGYFPALPPGQEETNPEVHHWEKRQPVAVTLGTVYDEWCLSRLASRLGKNDEHRHFGERSLNYRKLFHPETKFFHPKDESGRFIEPFDYRYSGGLGARDAYDENNGWVYRWDVQHNIADLIRLTGGNDSFVQELERMYSTPLGKAKYNFYATLPDHTGNVGQFSMGNEPSLHVPYLYNYARQPWRTQKRIRSLLTQWFRNDLMGIPGDEDGGGMSAFVVFSQLGFYPVTPGLPMYVIGSPVFERAVIQLENGKAFEVKCLHYSPENKYIQSARLDGVEWNKSWFSHDDLIKGGVLEFTMGRYPNKSWAAGQEDIPPSFEMQLP